MQREIEVYLREGKANFLIRCKGERALRSQDAERAFPWIEWRLRKLWPCSGEAFWGETGPRQAEHSRSMSYFENKFGPIMHWTCNERAVTGVVFSRDEMWRSNLK